MSATLTKKQASAISGELVTTAPADWGDARGQGMEGIDSSDQLIPFLRMLHYQCPQITEGDPGYIEGARPGMILNTATNEVVDGKLGGSFVPVMRDHSFVEYIPRDAGGGFVGVWSVSDPRIATMRAKQGAFGKLVTEDSHELIETYSLYGLFVPPKSDEVWRVVVGFTSTQIKKYKMLTTRLVGLIGTPPKYPMWAYQWHLSTQPETNKKNNGKYFGWRFVLEGGDSKSALMTPSHPLVTAASEFYKQLKTGQTQAHYESADDGNSASEDADIPF